MGEVKWNDNMEDVPKGLGETFLVKDSQGNVLSPCFFEKAGVISEHEDGDLILWVQAEPEYFKTVINPISWATIK